ncbi:hypothetical protein BDW22DRAFT_1359205 [Trametopsis cervina]|nr:hypothetical protein BDW22DRAFT_1359205 [Trametopsis cervina]
MVAELHDSTAEGELGEPSEQRDQLEFGPALSLYRMSARGPNSVRSPHIPEHKSTNKNEEEREEENPSLKKRKQVPMRPAQQSKARKRSKHLYRDRDWDSASEGEPSQRMKPKRKINVFPVEHMFDWGDFAPGPAPDEEFKREGGEERVPGAWTHYCAALKPS